MSVSISDGRYSRRFTDIRKEIYGKEFPASTLLTAVALAVPEIMVEITGIAVLAHVPEKWERFSEKDMRKRKESRAHRDSIQSGCALEE
jgi:hypothetical protein